MPQQEWVLISSVHEFVSFLIYDINTTLTTCLFDTDPPLVDRSIVISLIRFRHEMPLTNNGGCFAWQAHEISTLPEHGILTGHRRTRNPISLHYILFIKPSVPLCPINTLISYIFKVIVLSQHEVCVRTHYVASGPIYIIIEAAGEPEWIALVFLI